MTRRRAGPAGALGLLAVLLGLWVLRTPGAQAEVGWFSYDGRPPADVLDEHLPWNPTRAVGALLVLAGLLVLGHLLGTLAAARRAAVPAHLVGGLLVLAGVLVVGGAIAFVVLGQVDRSVATISISRAAGPLPRLTPAGTVWTRDQLSAALVVATGLVLGAVGTGLRRRARG